MNTGRTTRVKFKRKSRSLMLEEPKPPIKVVAPEPEPEVIVEPKIAVTQPAPVEQLAEELPENVLNFYPRYNTRNWRSQDVVDEVGNRRDTLGALLYAVLYRNRIRDRVFSEILTEVRYLAEIRLSKQPKDIRSSVRLYLTQLPKLKNFTLHVRRRAFSRTKYYRMERPDASRRFPEGRPSYDHLINGLPAELR